MTEEMRQTLNIHTDVLNVTFLHVAEIQEHQHKAIEAIKQLEANLVSFNTALDHIYNINSALHIISAISFASSALRDLDYKFSRFSKGLNKLNSRVKSLRIQDECSGATIFLWIWYLWELF